MTIREPICDLVRGKWIKRPTSTHSGLFEPIWRNVIEVAGNDSVKRRNPGAN